jgi:hypothetical protein
MAGTARMMVRPRSPYNGNFIDFYRNKRCRDVNLLRLCAMEIEANN